MHSIDSLLDSREYDHAAALLQGQLKETRLRKDHFGLLDTLCKLGICYYECSRLADAEAAFQEGTDIARRTGDAQLPRFLHELSMVRWKQNRLDEGVELCKEALDLELAAGKEGTMEMFTLSILYQESGQFAESLEVLQLVRESCEARQDLPGSAKCLNEIGNTYDGLTDYPAAIKHLVDSVELKVRIGDGRGAGLSLGTIERLILRHTSLVNEPEVSNQLRRLNGILR